MELILNGLIDKFNKTDYLYILLLIILLVISGSIIINQFKKALKKIIRKSHIKSPNINLLVNIFKYFLWFILIAIILRIVGLSDMALMLGGSATAITSIVIIKLISDVAENIFAGILLTFDDNIKAGNTVNYKSINGEIISIGIRKTKIKDRYNNIHLIPNKKLNDEIIVFPD